jgi:hypothetical protein
LFFLFVIKEKVRRTNGGHEEKRDFFFSFVFSLHVCPLFVNTLRREREKERRAREGYESK